MKPFFITISLLSTFFLGTSLHARDTVSEDPALTIQNNLAYISGQNTPYTGKYVFYSDPQRRFKLVEGYYENGLKTGLWTGWSWINQKSGKNPIAVKMENTHYLHGKKQGDQIKWHENGTEKLRITFKDDHPVGRYIGKDENGTPYVDGYLDDEGFGSQINWYDDGVLAGVQSFKNWEKHGVEYRWDGKGKRRADRIWENGKLVSGPPLPTHKKIGQ